MMPRTLLTVACCCDDDAASGSGDGSGGAGGGGFGPGPYCGCEASTDIASVPPLQLSMVGMMRMLCIDRTVSGNVVADECDPLSFECVNTLPCVAASVDPVSNTAFYAWQIEDAAWSTDPAWRDPVTGSALGWSTDCDIGPLAGTGVTPASFYFDCVGGPYNNPITRTNCNIMVPFDIPWSPDWRVIIRVEYDCRSNGTITWEVFVGGESRDGLRSTAFVRYSAMDTGGTIGNEIFGEKNRLVGVCDNTQLSTTINCNFGSITGTMSDGTSGSVTCSF